MWSTGAEVPGRPFIHTSFAFELFCFEVVSFFVGYFKFCCPFIFPFCIGHALLQISLRRETRRCGHWGSCGGWSFVPPVRQWAPCAQVSPSLHSQAPCAHPRPLPWCRRRRFTIVLSSARSWLNSSRLGGWGGVLPIRACALPAVCAPRGSSRWLWSGGGIGGSSPLVPLSLGPSHLERPQGAQRIFPPYSL